MEHQTARPARLHPRDPAAGKADGFGMRMGARHLRARNRKRDTAAATMTALGIGYVDIEIGRDERSPVRFTFFWKEAGTWEGRDYMVEVSP